MSARFERHARTVSLITMLSRITGLARDASLSRVFGAAGVMDAFFFAFMIPNLFRRLFGEGALAAAFLPVYSRLDRDDPATARQLASLTIAGLTAILGAAVLLAELILFLLSARQHHANLALWLTMVMLPYMPLVCLVAILGAMLQVHGKFGPTAAAPIVLNLCLIASALGLFFLLERDVMSPRFEHDRLLHIAVVAGSVVLAGILQVLWSLAALRGRRWWVARFAAARQPMRRVMRQALPMIVGLGVLQLNTLFDGVIASYPTAVGPRVFGIDYPLTEGAMAAVSFAQRLYQFPLGVFGIALATAIFPALARQADRTAPFVDTLRRGLRLVVFIGLPASAGLILVRRPLAAVVLQGGDFSPQDTARVAFVLLGYAPAVWAYSMTHTMTRAFYARADSTTPVKIALAVVCLNLALNCTLIWTPLREAGLAWSTAICAVIQAALLFTLLRRRLGHILDAPVLGSWLKSALATALMAAALLLVSSILPTGPEIPPSWTQALGTLAALVTTGALVFAVAAGALRMPELAWALGRPE